MTKDDLVERMKYNRVSERRATLFFVGIILFILVVVVLVTIGWIILIRIYEAVKLIG
jgi:cytoskeletal protein RodZ